MLVWLARGLFFFARNYHHLHLRDNIEQHHRLIQDIQEGCLQGCASCHLHRRQHVRAHDVGGVREAREAWGGSARALQRGKRRKNRRFKLKKKRTGLGPNFAAAMLIENAFLETFDVLTSEFPREV